MSRFLLPSLCTVLLFGCSDEDAPLVRPLDQGFGGDGEKSDISHRLSSIAVAGSFEYAVTMTLNDQADELADPLLFQSTVPLDGTTLPVDPGWGGDDLNLTLDVNISDEVDGTFTPSYEITVEN